MTLPRRGLRGRGSQGAVAIELALILPILLVVFAGVVDFALAFRQQIELRNAANAGGLFAAGEPRLVEYSGVATCANQNNVRSQAWLDFSGERADTPPSDFDVTVTISGTPATGCDISSPRVPPGTPVVVTVSNDYSFILFDAILSSPPTISLSASQEVRAR